MGCKGRGCPGDSQLFGAGVVYQQWTNPAAVRVQVVEILEKQFPGATVALDSARLRLFGSVVLTELRLYRHPGEGQGEGEAVAYDGEQSDFFYTPQATVCFDRERLLEGGPAVQRITMFRPRMRIVHNKDKTWNIEGLTGKADSTAPLPIFVIEQGTLIVEDKAAGSATWVVHDLEMTLKNDSNNCVTISGRGKSETLGSVAVAGTWNRATNAATLSLHLDGLAITRDLVQYLAVLIPDRLDGLHLEGRADLAADISYQPGATPALKHDVRCQFRQTTIDHPKLPVPLHNLSALVRCAEGKLTVEKLKAAAGTGKIECTASADLANFENNYELDLKASHLPLTKSLVDKLPAEGAKLRELYDLFQPAGTGKIHYHAVKQQGEWLRRSVILEPDDLTVCFKKFPYPVERLSGRVEYDLLKHAATIAVVGYTGALPINLTGTWTGSYLEAKGIIEVTGNGIPLDSRVVRALPDNVRKLAESFHADGKGNFRAVIQRIPGSLEFRNTFEIHFVDCHAQWDKFPFPLENLCGDLTVWPRDQQGVEQYEFKNFKGTHNGGTVYVSGQTMPRVEGGGDGRLMICITGHDLSLDNDLHNALSRSDYPKLGTTWDTFSPAGRFSFQCKCKRAGISMTWTLAWMSPAAPSTQNSCPSTCAISPGNSATTIKRSK